METGRQSLLKASFKVGEGNNSLSLIIFNLSILTSCTSFCTLMSHFYFSRSPQANEPLPESKPSCKSETRSFRTGEELFPYPAQIQRLLDRKRHQLIQITCCGKDCSRLDISSATKVFLSIISQRLLLVEAGNMTAPTRFDLAFFWTLNFVSFIHFFIDFSIN